MSKVPRLFFEPNEKVKVMLGNDWYDATVVRANKKTVLVRTLHSQTKYRVVPIKPEEAGELAGAIEAKGLTRLERYTVHDTKIVKLPHVRVKKLKDAEPAKTEQPTKADSAEVPDSEAKETPAPTSDPLSWIDEL